MIQIMALITYITLFIMYTTIMNDQMAPKGARWYFGIVFGLLLLISTSVIWM